MSVYEVKVKSMSLYPERTKCDSDEATIRVFLKLQVLNEAQWVSDGREEIADTITGKSFCYSAYVVLCEIIL